MAYEALLHADDGRSPAELFAAARTDGTIADLDRIGRETAIRDAAPWIGSALLFVKIAAPIVALPQGWLDSMTAVAREVGLPMKQVVLEVVQPAVGDPLEVTARVVVRSRGAGCQVALVGAGDAGVVRSLVGALLPDYVTLHRSVVARLPAPDAVSIAQGLLREAAAGAARVIAFGVESEAQAAAVADAGVPWAQGWLYGHPKRP